MTQYTLDSLVREYLVMKGDDNPAEYLRTLQAAISTLKDLHYDVSGVPNVEVLTVESGGRATLPQDVIRVIRLGFLNAAGKFVEIYSDNNLAVNAQGNYNTTTGQNEVNGIYGGLPINPSQSDFAGMFRNGQVIGRQYGNQGGGVYNFRMDWDRGLVEFSSNVSGDVVLEYLGDPKVIDGKHHVHPFLVDPILDGIHYRMMRYKRSYSPAEKQEAHRIYLNSKHNAQVRFMSSSIGEMYNASRKTINGSLKY